MSPAAPKLHLEASTTAPGHWQRQVCAVSNDAASAAGHAASCNVYVLQLPWSKRDWHGQPAKYDSKLLLLASDLASTASSRHGAQQAPPPDHMPSCAGLTHPTQTRPHQAPSLPQATYLPVAFAAATLHVTVEVTNAAPTITPGRPCPSTPSAVPSLLLAACTLQDRPAVQHEGQHTVVLPC